MRFVDMGDIAWGDVRPLLDNVAADDPVTRNSTAAALSKVAAKAEGPPSAQTLAETGRGHVLLSSPSFYTVDLLCLADDVLEYLAGYANYFVAWLAADEPLVRAYTACILANIAFLEPGQREVLDAGGVPPLVRLLKSKEDTKVTLHSTAAVQNLTYKNTQHSLLFGGH